MIVVSTLHDRGGFTLALVLFAVVLLSALGLSLTTLTLATRAEADFGVQVDRAAYVARAGFERTCAEVLLPSNDWSTATELPFVDATFADASYDVVVSDRTPDGVRVTVEAVVDGTERTLAFVAVRLSHGGATTGVRLERVIDPTLDVLGM